MLEVFDLKQHNQMIFWKLFKSFSAFPSITVKPFAIHF